MDLNEWVILPDDGFLEIHDDGGKKIFSRKYGSTALKTVFNMNYFDPCPSPDPPKFVEFTENPRVPKQIVPLPIQELDLPKRGGKSPDREVAKEVTSKVPIQIDIRPSAVSEIIKPRNMGVSEADQDMVSQVFFKPKKETEFVDMKMDSPKSGNRGIVPQIDVGTFQFEDKGEAFINEAMESKNCSPRIKAEKEMVIKKNNNLDSDINEVNWEEANGGLKIWKWSLTGIGAICSFGVATAATICIVILGSRQKNKKANQNQKKLHFQIYTDDKRIKQVVHHATKLNEAISAVRGVPLSRAHVTVGGYYEGL